MGRHRKKREQKGLRVDVRHNNVEWALKKLKRMVKDSGQMLELKKRSYYKKKSTKGDDDDTSSKRGFGKDAASTFAGLGGGQF